MNSIKSIIAGEPLPIGDVLSVFAHQESSNDLEPEQIEYPDPTLPLVTGHLFGPEIRHESGNIDRYVKVACCPHGRRPHFHGCSINLESGRIEQRRAKCGRDYRLTVE